jgi:hypothetical protein
MPKIESITLTHDELVDVSIRMDKLSDGKHSQGWLEWLLFRAISDVKQVDLFECRPDECSCGELKQPQDSMCERCAIYA